MGSTGMGIFRQSTEVINRNTYGIDNARAFFGNLPKSTGMDKIGANLTTLRISSYDTQDIIFQFKLLKGGKLSIRAYDPNSSTRANVTVDADSPSLDRVIRYGEREDKNNAQKIRAMMNKSSTISESQLVKIAQDLKGGRRRRTI